MTPGQTVIRRGGGCLPVRIVAIDGPVVTVRPIDANKKECWNERLSELIPYP